MRVTLDRMALTNWSENLTYSTTDLRRPTSVDELCDIVGNASTVKGLGTRHCFNDIADTGGVLVSTADLGLDVEIDHETMTATVPGASSYAEVSAKLEAAGVALANLGSLPHISVAGATATGTHGSGDGNQVLAGSIAAIELVAADGSLRTVRRGDAYFPAIALGVGAFGIITRLTLDVEPSYHVQQEMYAGPTWSHLLAEIDAVFASAYSVNLHAAFSDESTRVIWQKRRVEGRPTEPVAVPAHVVGAPRVDPARVPPNPDRTELGTPGPWSTRLAHFRPDGAPSMGGDELQTEYFVAREHAVDAIEALRAMGERVDPHLWGTEIRTVAADDLWLSPAFESDCLSIGFTWKKHPAEVGALLPELEAALAGVAARPHWGKLFAMGPDVLRERLPRFDDVADAVRRWDPEGVFSNPYLERLGLSAIS